MNTYEIYATALEAKDSGNDDLAIQKLVHLIKNYPESREAGLALSLLDREYPSYEDSTSLVPAMGDYMKVEDYCAVTGENPAIIKCNIDANDCDGKIENGSYFIKTDESTHPDAIKKIREERKKNQKIKLDNAIDSQDFSEFSLHEIDSLSKGMLLTTETALFDIKILQRIDIISAETVFGVNMFRDMFASIRNVVGGRSGAMQKVRLDARNTCLLELRREALMVGANAIIGVDLDYSEISGGGKTMLMLVANGTAVKIEEPNNRQ